MCVLFSNEAERHLVYRPHASGDLQTLALEPLHDLRPVYVWLTDGVAELGEAAVGVPIIAEEAAKPMSRLRIVVILGGIAQLLASRRLAMPGQIAHQP